MRLERYENVEMMFYYLLNFILNVFINIIVVKEVQSKYLKKLNKQICINFDDCIFFVFIIYDCYIVLLKSYLMNCVCLIFEYYLVFF